jgi:hypothetical protein
MPVDAADLVALAQHTLAERKESLSDEELILDLLADAHLLAGAIEDVVGDGQFWQEVTGEVEWLSLSAGERQVDLLERLTAERLPGVLRAIGYHPPPPVLEFVDDTIEAVVASLETRVSPAERVERVAQARWALDTFSLRLRRMETEREPQRPSFLRRNTRRAARALLVTAPAYAVVGAKFGGEALTGVPGDALEPLVAPIAASLAVRVQSVLHDREGELEVASALEALAPRRRVSALSGVVLGHLNRLQAAAFDSREARQEARLAAARAARVAQRHLAIEDPLARQLESMLGLMHDEHANARDLFLAWVEIDTAMLGSETLGEKEARLASEAAAAQAAQAPRKAAAAHDVIGADTASSSSQEDEAPPLQSTH